MKNKLLALTLSLLLLTGLSAGALRAHADSSTVAQAQALCDGIVGFKEAAAGVSTAQELIDTALCDTAGSSAEFYVIALSQYGSYDFSSYERALKRYLSNTEVYSATSREKYALALIASGSTDPYIAQVMDNAIGEQGIMSLVFGLHLLNNGYRSSYHTAESVIHTILSMQLSDGGWAVMGSSGDVDVTSMTLQALAPYYDVYSDVHSGIDRALSMLSSRQNSDGSYSGMGTVNLESTAQVLCALSILGIDQAADTRFIKNGSTVLDAMQRYRLSDGSFSHAGGAYDENATTQAFYCTVAYLRMCCGQGSLYIIDRRDPAGLSASAGEQREQDTPAEERKTTYRTPSGRTYAADDGEVFHTPDGDFIEIVNENGQTETVRVTAQDATDSSSEATVNRNETVIQPTRALPDYDRDPAVLTRQGATLDSARSESDKPGYKLYAVLGIIVISGGVYILLYALKRRSKKNFIAVAVVAGAAVLFVLLTNFSSAESYYGDTADKSEPVGTVTMTIRCDTVLDDDDLPYFIPEDGIILAPSEFAIEDGDTVLDVLIEGAREYGISVENDSKQSAAYISGINYLYEFDFGELSGWMYRVNGELPPLSCNQYVLSDGDSIEWLYTREIGNDL